MTFTSIKYKQKRKLELLIRTQLGQDNEICSKSFVHLTDTVFPENIKNYLEKRKT